MQVFLCPGDGRPVASLALAEQWGKKEKRLLRCCLFDCGG